MNSLFLENEQQTLDFGDRFGHFLFPGCVVFLEGDLGCGKTTFVRGVIQGLGYKGKVKSPTYTLVETYGLTPFEIYHFDLYRLADPEELEFLGIRDYFNSQSVVFVEWPEKGIGCLPTPDIIITFKYANNGRLSVVEARSVLGEKVCAQLYN